METTIMIVWLWIAGSSQPVTASFDSAFDCEQRLIQMSWDPKFDGGYCENAFDHTITSEIQWVKNHS